MRKLLLAAGLPVVFVLLIGAAALYGAAGATQFISGNIFTDTSNPFTVLLVNKRTSELYIAQVKDNLPLITKTYSALYGRNTGDKHREGDNKTPEGFYYITGYMPPKKLNAAIYGDGAFKLNYPNIMDKIKGKTGHGIWIHGRGAGRDNEKTQGCISLANSDLASLKSTLLPGTPVIISDNIEFLNAEEYAKHKKEYMDMFKAYISSWEKGDYNGFASYFSANFRGNEGLTAESYLNKKKQIMALNQTRKVIVSNVNIFKENSTKLMYTFDQFYCSGDVLSYGAKKLYLLAEKEGDYRIIAEEFTKLDVEPVIEKDVITTLNKWKDVWQARDIEKYISYYSGSFRSENMDIKQWKAHKEGLFNNTNSIKINLSDIKLKFVSPGKIVVSFIQKYTSGVVSDKGIKTLVLSGCPGDYKIVEEGWRAT